MKYIECECPKHGTFFIHMKNGHWIHNKVFCPVCGRISYPVKPDVNDNGD